MQAQPATPEILPDVQPGSVTLEGLRDGQVVEELADALKELCTLTRLHNKKGKLTLTLFVEPRENDQVIIADEINLTPPKSALPATIRFQDKSGNLVRNNPNRPDLMAGLREIASGDGDKVRELGDE